MNYSQKHNNRIVELVVSIMSLVMVGCLVLYDLESFRERFALYALTIMPVVAGQYFLLLRVGNVHGFLPVVLQLAIIFFAFIDNVLFFCVASVTCCLLLPLLVRTPRWENTNRYHKPIALGIIYGLIASSMLLAKLLVSYTFFQFNLWLLWPLVSLGIAVATGAWLYAKRLTQSNPRFFSRVLVSEGKGGNKADGLLDAVDEMDMKTPEGLFLATLLKPAKTVTRLREGISPAKGCFHIVSHYEFKIPKELNNGDSVILPIAFRGKNELTNGLEIVPEPGVWLRKMGRDEIERWTEKCLAKILSRHVKGTESNSPDEVARRVAKTAIENHLYESEEEFSEKRLETLEYAREYNHKLVELMNSLMISLRYVRPICVELTWGDAEGVPKEYIRLTIRKNLSLVPVRRIDANGSKSFPIRDRIKRLFTKKRMRYYFGLGNADCARRYHLTFCGPEKTYLSFFNLLGTGDNNEFFIADKMYATNRYDQQVSRLYIRNGRGFSRAALAISYEECSHRSIMALCGTSVVCLLLLLYFGLGFVAPMKALALTSSEIVLPLTVLSIGSIISIWEAMEEYRAEEWLWMGAVLSIVVSLAASAHLVLFAVHVKYAYIPSVFDVSLWIAYIVIEFFVAETSAMVLFEQVKQHGDLMYKVPLTRSAVEDDFHNAPKIDFQRAIENMRNGVTKRGECIFPKPDPKWANAVSIKYCFDAHQYKDLIGKDWVDGWLVPIWSGLVNPYCSPSEDFCNYAEEILNWREQSSALFKGARPSLIIPKFN